VQKRKETNSKRIVFSRWSRKNYAIFSSLKKVVNIGRLSVDICRTSLLKCTTIIRHIFLARNTKNEEGLLNEHDSQKKQLWEQLFPFITVELSMDSVPEQKIDIQNYTGKPIFCMMQNMGFLFLIN